MTSTTEPDAWIGKTRTRTASIDHRQAELLAATLGKPVPEEGAPLPPCWHWAWFNEARPADELGRDGHPEHGDFLPPVALPRRMWAGGELVYHRPVHTGDPITRHSTIEDIKQKSGRSGVLTIVTVKHEFFKAGKMCIAELQNLVFRENPKPDAPNPAPPAPPDGAELQREITPDEIMMFRYSAITFNGHRIHYDVDYARDVEGYPGLVFHAPLTATLLAGLACEMAGNTPLKSYSYRATSPLYCGQTFRICAKRDAKGVLVWAQTPGGGLAMEGHAGLQESL